MIFEGKTAIVAGGGGGMGLSVANDLVRAGAHVTVLDLKPAPEELETSPGTSTYVQGDVTDEAFVQRATEQAASAHDRLDYLVNTTGVLWFDRDVSLVDVDMDVWDRVLEINLKSIALTARHAIPLMKRSGGGAMVHISSCDALRGDGRPQDAYGVSKAAILRLSKSIAIQFAKDGIRSNSILPGPVLSPMQQRWVDDPGTLDTISEFVPLGRVGTPQDIADACLFLLSDKASFVTGTELIVDGGCMAKP
jgi:NAD(P)-dependent dehydrogenase (short-subunit alcohol dehydrogenase family)